MKIKLLAAIILLIGWSHLSSHETFLLPVEFDIEEREAVKVLLITGKFDASLFPLPKEGIDSLNLYGSNGTEAINLEAWESEDPDSRIWKAWQELKSIAGLTNHRKTSSFELGGLDSGSFIIGYTQTISRIAVEKEKFQGYLLNEVHLNANEAKNITEDSLELVKEAYIKYSKTILQVGDNLTENITDPIGHAAEIVPMTHPAHSSRGETMEFKILLDGKAKGNQPVIVGRDTGPFNKTADTIAVLRSDENGIVTLPITHDGVWWIHFIHVAPSAQGDEFDYASKWGSLTFQIQ